MALGTWSAVVSRTILKYEDIRRRMSSVSRASRSVRAGSAFCSGFGQCQQDVQQYQNQVVLTNNATESP